MILCNFLENIPLIDLINLSLKYMEIHSPAIIHNKPACQIDFYKPEKKNGVNEVLSLYLSI